MYKHTCILYTSQCFLNCCWASKGPFGQGKARDWPRLLGPRLLGPRHIGPSLLGTLMYKVAFSFHHMAVINFTDLISSGVRAQQGQAWRRRCCVVFDQEFQPVLSLVSHLFSPAKKCCKPWEMVEKRRDFYQSITWCFNSSGTNFFLFNSPFSLMAVSQFDLLQIVFRVSQENPVTRVPCRLC